MIVPGFVCKAVLGKIPFLGPSENWFSRNPTSCRKGEGQAGFGSATQMKRISLPLRGRSQFLLLGDFSEQSRADAHLSALVARDNGTFSPLEWGLMAGRSQAGEGIGTALAPGMNVPRSGFPLGVFSAPQKPDFADECEISHLPVKSSRDRHSHPSSPPGPDTGSDTSTCIAAPAPTWGYSALKHE